MVAEQSPPVEMSEGKKERFSNGPQREQENKFKGKVVSILAPGFPWLSVSGTYMGRFTGKLVWVDVYAYGLLEDRHDEPTIIFKGPGVTVSLDPQS